MVIDFKQSKDRKAWDNIMKRGEKSVSEGKQDFMHLTDLAVEALADALGLTGDEEDYLDQMHKDPIFTLLSHTQELYLRTHFFPAETKAEEEELKVREDWVRRADKELTELLK